MIRAYLDNNATTRLAPEALAAMTPYLTDHFLNPSSRAGQILGMGDPGGDARRAVAALFGDVDAAAGVVITSGASEANSWAVASATIDGEPGRLAISAIEHPSINEAARACEMRGWVVDVLPVDASGHLQVAAAQRIIRSDTRLVCAMAANNETGVVQPLRELGAAVRAIAPGAHIHVDVTQAVGRLSLDLWGDLAEADTLALSAHKFGGPKGVGALFARPSVKLRPLIHGHQEDGLRGGTPDPAGAAGLAAAATQARAALLRASAVAALRDHFEAELRARLPQVRINGSGAPRLPNTSSIIVPGLDATEAVDQLAAQGICIATGSACTSGSPAPSHVLIAMGVAYDDARSTLRISLSPDTTIDEINLAGEAIVRLWDRSRMATAS